MRTIQQTTQFKKDVKRAKKRGKQFGDFKMVIEQLAHDLP